MALVVLGRKWSLAISLYSVIPDLDGPVCTAGDENPRVEVVPPDSVHRHAVSIIRLQQLLGVGFGALRKTVDIPPFVYLSMFSDWARGMSQYNPDPGAAQTQGLTDMKQIGRTTVNSCLVTQHLLFVIRFPKASRLSDVDHNSMTCGNSCCTDRLIVDLWRGEEF